MPSPPLRAVLVVLALALGLSGGRPRARRCAPAAGTQAGRPVRPRQARAATSSTSSAPCNVGTPGDRRRVVERRLRSGRRSRRCRRRARRRSCRAPSATGSSNALANWMIGAATAITRFVAARDAARRPRRSCSRSWYEAQFAPMADLGAALALLVALIALASAAIRRSPEALAATLVGIVRAGFGTGVIVALTVIGLGIADAISSAVLASSPHTFWETVAHAWGTQRLRRLRLLGAGGVDRAGRGVRRAVRVARADRPRRRDLHRGAVLPGRARGVDLAGARGVDGAPRPAAAAVRDAQAGRADRALARRQRGRRRPVLRQRRPGLGRDDPRRGRDLRARRVRAVGADVPARRRRRERLRGRRYARGRRQRRRRTSDGRSVRSGGGLRNLGGQNGGSAAGGRPPAAAARPVAVAAQAAAAVAAATPPRRRARGRRRRRRRRYRHRGGRRRRWRWAERRPALAASPRPPARSRAGARRRADRTPRAPARAALAARRAAPSSERAAQGDSGATAAPRRMARASLHGCRRRAPAETASPDAGGPARAASIARAAGGAPRASGTARRDALRDGRRERRSAAATLVAAPAASTTLAGVERHGLAPDRVLARSEDGRVDDRDDLPVRAAPRGRVSARAAHPAAVRVHRRRRAGARRAAARRARRRSRSRCCAWRSRPACCWCRCAGSTLEQWAPLTVRFLLGRFSVALAVSRAARAARAPRRAPDGRP